jgi:hypothetical protein
MSESYSLYDEFVRLSGTHLAFTVDDSARACKLSVALVDLLIEKATCLIRNQPHDPKLYAYQSDAWSHQVCTRTSHHVGLRTVFRDNRTKTDFLLERSIVKSMDPSGRVRIAMLMAPPRSLSSGKKGWRIFFRGVRLLRYAPLPRRHGRLHVCVFARRLDARPAFPTRRCSTSLVLSPT